MASDTPQQQPKAEKLAQHSFVLACGSILCGITAIPALVQAMRALVFARRNGAAKEAWLKAIASLVFSSCTLVFFGFVITAPFRSAQAMADEINCCSHIKGLAVEVRIYESENGDAFPPLNKWCDALVESVTNEPTPRVLSFHCPSAPKSHKCGYAINVNLKEVKETSQLPDDTVVLFESDAGWNGFGDFTSAVARHHGSRLWVAFADGSVKDVSLNELPTRRWKPSTNTAPEKAK